MTKELTGKALFMALRSQRPPAGLIHHSDRGSQYCAYDYRVIQEQFGLKTSMSRSHHACRTECDAMTAHYYRLREYAMQHPEAHAILRIID